MQCLSISKSFATSTSLALIARRWPLMLMLMLMLMFPDRWQKLPLFERHR